MHRTHTGLWWKVVPKSISIQMVSSRSLYALSHYSMRCTGCQICAHTSLSRQAINTNSTGLGEESPVLRTVKLHYQQVCCVIRLTCIVKKKQKIEGKMKSLSSFTWREKKWEAWAGSDWNKAISVTKFKSNEPPEILHTRHAFTQTFSFFSRYSPSIPDRTMREVFMVSVTQNL